MPAKPIKRNEFVRGYTGSTTKGKVDRILSDCRGHSYEELLKLAGGKSNQPYVVGTVRSVVSTLSVTIAKDICN